MKRVLIVDYASFMRMSIKNMLANYDFEIVGEAENGVMTYIQPITNTQKTIYTQKTIPQKESRGSPQSLPPARKRRKPSCGVCIQSTQGS